VQIDRCQGCKFFIGPSFGSVFVRDCVECTFIVACGQLRVRDCKDCIFSLYCKSRPVIESCSKIGFCCFLFHGYFQLRDHFSMAKLSVYNNRWDTVHDFTPGPSNYYIVPFGDPVQQLLIPPLSSVATEFISPDEESVMAKDVVVPYSHGTSVFHSASPAPSLIILLLMPGQLAAADTFSAEIVRDPAVRLLRTVELEFTEDDLSLAFRHTHLTPQEKDKLLGGPIIGFAVMGATNTHPAVVNLLNGINTLAYFAPSVPSTVDLMEAIFDKIPAQGSGFGSKLK